MEDKKGRYYELYYNDIYTTIESCPEDFPCIIQKFYEIDKELKENSIDDYDYENEIYIIKSVFGDALNDAYDNKVIDSSTFLLWKSFHGDVIYPPE